MRKITIFAIVIMVLSLLLVACGGDADSPSGGDGADAVSRGESLYKGMTIGAASAPGCISCHTLEADVVLVGPSHAGIGTRAETAVAGKSAEEYLRESILEPDAEITDGFTAGLMYANYGTDLSDQEVDDLVAFLMTLK